jgi:hypothetical protein
LGQPLPPSLSPEFCAAIQFQAGLINVNALEGRSISRAGVAAIGSVAANADFYRA